MRKNHLYTVNKYNKNLYSLGSAMSTASSMVVDNAKELQKKAARKAMWDQIGKASAVAGMTAVGQIGGSLLGKGFDTAVGSTIDNVGSTIGGAIGGIKGGLVTVASKLVGGLYNRAFGANLNKENIANIENTNKALSTTVVDDSSNEALLASAGNINYGSSFTQKDVGKNGWLNHKATDKFNELNKKREAAIAHAGAAVSNAAKNVANTQFETLMANSMAYGGPLDFGDGAIGYSFLNKYLSQEPESDNTIHSMPNSFMNEHAFGGELNTQGADYTNGLIWVNNGGTHERNPFDGVPVGVDPEGVPNLVEEGEVIYNDYVFSNRLKVPKKFRKEFKLGGDLNKPMTFAEAVKVVSKESEERPNDPVSQNGLKASLANLAAAQEMIRARKQRGQEYAKGGKLGNRHDWGSYLNSISQQYLSDPVSPEIARIPSVTKTDLGSPRMILPAEWSETGNWVRPDIERPTLPASQRQKLSDEVMFDTVADTSLNGISTALSKARTLDLGKYKKKNTDSEASNKGLQLWWDAAKKAYKNVQGNTDIKDRATWSRYTPVASAAAGILQNVLSKPDYSNADRVELAAQAAARYTPIKAPYLGNYLSYDPLDIAYQSNLINAQSGATRRAIENQASGNPSAAASLLAADFNTQNALGAAYRAAKEQNMAQRQAVATFNRGTDQANSEMGLKAAMANSEMDAKAKQLMYTGTLQALQMREAIDQARAEALNANYSNFAQGLGDIGKENAFINMVNNNPALLYLSGVDGVKYKSDKAKQAANFLSMFNK